MIIRCNHYVIVLLYIHTVTSTLQRLSFSSRDLKLSYVVYDGCMIRASIGCDCRVSIGFHDTCKVQVVLCPGRDLDPCRG